MHIAGPFLLILASSPPPTPPASAMEKAPKRQGRGLISGLTGQIRGQALTRKRAGGPKASGPPPPPFPYIVQARPPLPFPPSFQITYTPPPCKLHNDYRGSSPTMSYRGFQQCRIRAVSGPAKTDSPIDGALPVPAFTHVHSSQLWGFRITWLSGTILQCNMAALMW
jgi:hypothetical protein